MARTNYGQGLDPGEIHRLTFEGVRNRTQPKIKGLTFSEDIKAKHRLIAQEIFGDD